MPILTAANLTVNYAELEVLSGVDLEVTEHARIGVVGPNGQGKTTLIKVLIGELQPDAGEVSRARGITLGYVPQNPSPATDGTLKDEIMTTFDEILRLETALADSAMQIQRAATEDRRQAERRYASLLQEYEAAGGYDYTNRMERVVDGVGLSPEVLEAPVASSSGGERTRAALAKALLSNPNLLVLDEPTNFLDFEGLSWLEGFLGRYLHAFVVVSHDRYFLDSVTDQIWEVDNCRLKRYPGNYTKYRILKEEQERRLQTDYLRQQEYIARQQSFIDRYRAGQRSREAKGRERRLKRLERLDAVPRQRSVNISDFEASRTGQVALGTQGLKIGYEERGRQVQLLSVPDLTLERGSRTAMIGRNGAGKTTLLRTILGEVPPLHGSVYLGHNVRAGFQRQSSHDLPESSTVLDTLLDVKSFPLREARSYLARFLFQGDDVFQSVSSLSGGEYTRLALARLFVTGANFLVLDEPTTHLDIPAREAMEQALLAYEGTLLLVTHDRKLISLLADQLWLVEDGSIRVFEGLFEEWVSTVQKPVAQVVAKTKKRPSVKTRAKIRKKEPSSEPKQDPEALISDIEDNLARIEAELQVATGEQDVERITQLGREYVKTQEMLERAWAEWGA